jgi:lipopolysaccharide/colanic/teichoic acid biosynthesis glycosyltransferase
MAAREDERGFAGTTLVAGSAGLSAAVHGFKLAPLTAAKAAAAARARLRSGGLHTAPGWQLAMKRAIDVIGASLALLLLSPVLIAAAIAVKLSSPGPVFYVSDRVGKDGHTFPFAKFRSMRSNAEYEKPQLVELNEASGPVFKVRDDPRITKAGRVLRKLSIDELPQLFHVLSGKMTLVGPRPPLPEEVVTYSEIEWQRLLVKPGITCIWQVSGRSDLDFDTWVQMDIQYIKEWTVSGDLRLLLRTIPAVLTGRGAY